MPQILLKKMLYSLCSCGADFCHPGHRKTDLSLSYVREDNSISEDDLNPQSDVSEFSRRVPGRGKFKPSPLGNSPYYAPERHPGHIEIIFPVAGVIDFLIDSEWKKLDFPKTHILFRNTTHTERHCDNKPYTLFWLTSLPHLLTLHKTMYDPAGGYSQSACRIAIMPPMSQALWKCGSLEHPDEAHYFSLLVQCLEYACSHSLVEQSTRDYHHTIVEEIKAFLDENFAEQISLEDLARMAHCSPIHLNRLFLSKYQKTIHQHLLDRRLEAAKYLLGSGFSSGDSAVRSGFQDKRYFSRFFRMKTGFSPTEFRARFADNNAVGDPPHTVQEE